MTTTAAEAPVARPPAQPPRLDGLIRLPQFAPISDEQLERLSAENPGWLFEIDGEELIINMYAGDESGDAEFEIGGQVRNWRVSGGGGRGRGASSGYRMTDETGLSHLMQADASWISPERLEQATREELTGATGFAPDFVLEVRSPSDSIDQQRTKMQLWLHHGVRLGWLVDMANRDVWVYRADREPERFQRPDTLSGEDVMVGLEVDFSDVWRLADEAAARNAESEKD